MKLTDAIRMSEMLSSLAGKKVTIKDASGNGKEYDLREIVSGKEEDPMLKPGDAVLVPRSENPLFPPDPATQIHVSGAVVLPSHWPWTNGLKLTDAITMVGGLTKYADGRVQINHPNSGTSDRYNLQDIQSGRAENPALNSGDDIHLQPERSPPN
jgi:protein involved in polysaccharide export with SLBB domain